LAAQNFCDKTKKKTFQKGSQFYRLNPIGTNIKHSKPHQVWFLSKKKCFSKKKKRRIKVLRVKRDHRLSGHLRSLIERVRVCLQTNRTPNNKTHQADRHQNPVL